MKVTETDSLFIDAMRWMFNNNFVSLYYDSEEEAITLTSVLGEPWERQEFTSGSPTYNKIVEFEILCRKRIGKSFKIEL